MNNLICPPGSLANKPIMLAFCLTHAIETKFLNRSTSKGGLRDGGVNSITELGPKEPLWTTTRSLEDVQCPLASVMMPHGFQRSYRASPAVIAFSDQAQCYTTSLERARRLMVRNPTEYATPQSSPLRLSPLVFEVGIKHCNQGHFSVARSKMKVVGLYQN